MENTRTIYGKKLEKKNVNTLYSQWIRERRTAMDRAWEIIMTETVDGQTDQKRKTGVKIKSEIENRQLKLKEKLEK